MSRFFSDEAYEPQVDPFNAGEPVLPWNDPEALHDEACELPADGGYAAEEKPRDDYRAPERPVARRAKRPMNADTQPADNLPKQSIGGSSKQSVAANGKPGCIRGVYKTVAFVVLAMILFSTFSSCASDLLDDASDSATSSDDGALDYSQEQTDADEQAIIDAISARMDSLASDPGTAELAKQGLDKKLKSYVGYTAEELGIDGDAYAAWFLSKMSYQVAYAYSYDDGTGSVSLDITSPVAYRLASDLYDKASNFLMENELYGSYDDTEATPLTPGQQDQMRGFFADVLTDTEPSDNGYMSVAAIKGADGTWQLSESAIKGELNYLFGVN